MENKCDWCEEGICTYCRSVEEQFDDEQNGLPVDYCDGSIEWQRECGISVAKDIFIEPICLTMTNEEVNEVLDRCRRKVIEYGSTDL